jgi:DNA-binding Lrp family transcriptional regulator
MRSQAAAERVRRMEDACIITGYRAELGLEKLILVTAITRISAPEENYTAGAPMGRSSDGVRESPRAQ